MEFFSTYNIYCLSKHTFPCLKFLQLKPCGNINFEIKQFLTEKNETLSENWSNATSLESSISPFLCYLLSKHLTRENMLQESMNAAK